MTLALPCPVAKGQCRLWQANTGLLRAQISHSHCGSNLQGLTQVNSTKHAQDCWTHWSGLNVPYMSPRKFLWYLHPHHTQ